MKSWLTTLTISLHTPSLFRDNMSGLMESRSGSIESAPLKSLPHSTGQTPTAAIHVSGGMSGGGNSHHSPARDRADDFKPGSHLEVGELVKRRICPFDGIGSGGATNGYALTLLSKPYGESSVDPRHGSEFLPQGSGMSEYPAPTYPEQIMGRTYA